MSQQDFEVSQFGRRASDLLPPQQCACGKEVMTMLQKIEGDIRDIKHGMGTIRTAFVRNDLGDPDYEGHRQAHIQMIERHKFGEKAKEAGALKIVAIVVAAVMAIFMTGLSVHIQKLFGG